MPWTAENSEGYPAPAALAVDTAVLTVRDGEVVALAVRRDDGALGATRRLRRRRRAPGRDGASQAPREDRTSSHLRRAARRLRRPRTRPARMDPFDRVPRARPARHRAARRERAAGSALAAATGSPTTTARSCGARVDRLEGKLWWSNIAVGILPGPFTMSEARRVYEAIAGVRYDAATFARDLKATGLVDRHGRAALRRARASGLAVSLRVADAGVGRRSSQARERQPGRAEPSARDRGADGEDGDGGQQPGRAGDTARGRSSPRRTASCARTR